MKITDYIVTFCLVIIAGWAVQYFFISYFKGDNQAPVSSDRSFIAPVSVQTAEPLDLDVNFYDEKPTRAKKITTVYTKYGTLDFSNDGAILDRVVYNRSIGDQETLIETVRPSSDKEKGAFLVALNGLGNTPYYYNLLENKKREDSTVLIYKAESLTASIIKEFVIYNDIYKIDFNLSIEPKKNTQLRPRIFFPAPYLTDPDITDVVRGVLFTEKQAVEKKALKDLNLFGKENPTLFGLEDHYFINILISDPQHFAKRAYFRLEGTESADAVLQYSSINEKTSWNLSFYFGPKEVSALEKVDKRLEDVLEYGWFWFISRPLLYLLNFLYSIVRNYGWAIILLTILIRLLLLPFTLKGEKSAKSSIEAQRKLKYIEQKYKDDPERVARERAEFMRKHGFGMIGCLPLFLQIPVFIGLNRVLTNAIELYKAPFLWISDLSSRDPYYILPILVGVSFALQTTQAGDPKQKVTNILIALILAAFSSNFSAGLSLYLCVSTFLGVAQTYLQKAIKV